MRVRYYHYAENISLIVWGLYLFSESSRHFPNYSLWNWKGWRKYPRKKWMRHFLGNKGVSQIPSAPRDLFIHLLPSWHHRCHWVKIMSLHNEQQKHSMKEASVILSNYCYWNLFVHHNVTMQTIINMHRRLLQFDYVLNKRNSSKSSSVTRESLVLKELVTKFPWMW